MRGITDQHLTPGMPTAGNWVSEKSPQEHIIHTVQPFRHGTFETGERRSQVCRVIRTTPAFVGPLDALLDGNYVATTTDKWITDQVPPRTHMDLNLGCPFVIRNDRAPSHLTCEEWFRGVIDPCPHRRSQSVRPNQQVVAIKRMTVGGRYEFGALFQLHPCRERGIDQKRNQVRAMHSEKRQGWAVLCKFQCHHIPTRQSVDQSHAFDSDRHLLQRVHQAQSIEHIRAIGTDLDARADFAKRRRAFRHAHIVTQSRQTCRHG